MYSFLLIGSGKFGQNYVKTISEHFPNINLTIATKENWRNLLVQTHYSSSKIDAVIIATQPDKHIQIACESLSRNIPTIIEKPLALNYSECLLLQEFAKCTPVLINNIHLFAPAFEMLCDKIKKDPIKSITSFGFNNGPVRDYSSLFDYGSHDIAMGMFITQAWNIERGLACIANGNNEKTIANYMVNLKYNKNINHTMIVGNSGAFKKRYFGVNTEYHSYVYDDMSENKLYIDGLPQEIKKISPLQNMLECFIKNINNKNIEDKRFGLTISSETIRLLEQIDFSIKNMV